LAVPHGEIRAVRSSIVGFIPINHIPYGGFETLNICFY